jgi:hypothetical protein
VLIVLVNLVVVLFLGSSDRAFLLKELRLIYGHFFVGAGHLALEVGDQTFVTTISREASNKDDLKDLSSQLETLALRGDVKGVFRSAGLLLTDEGYENVVNCFKAIFL